MTKGLLAGSHLSEKFQKIFRRGLAGRLLPSHPCLLYKGELGTPRQKQDKRAEHRAEGPH